MISIYPSMVFNTSLVFIQAIYGSKPWHPSILFKTFIQIIDFSPGTADKLKMSRIKCLKCKSNSLHEDGSRMLLKNKNSFSDCHSLSLSLSRPLSLPLSLSLSVSLFTSLCLWLSGFICICLSLCLSLCLCVSVSLCICPIPELQSTDSLGRVHKHIQDTDSFFQNNKTKFIKILIITSTSASSVINSSWPSHRIWTITHENWIICTQAHVGKGQANISTTKAATHPVKISFLNSALQSNPAKQKLFLSSLTELNLSWNPIKEDLNASALIAWQTRFTASHKTDLNLQHKINNQNKIPKKHKHFTQWTLTACMESCTHTAGGSRHSASVGHIMWQIRTLRYKVEANLLCFLVFHIYFVVGWRPKSIAKLDGGAMAGFLLLDPPLHAHN